VGLLRLATTEQGRFQARFSQITSDRLHLIAVEESLPRIAFVRVPFDRILVAFTLKKSALPSHAEALSEPLAASPSWFMRITAACADGFRNLVPDESPRLVHTAALRSTETRRSRGANRPPVVFMSHLPFWHSVSS
jgi:hypothetical protein